FDLLWELLDHRGLVLTRDQLLERVWGYTFAGDTRTVDVHVRQLRRKLGDASPIVTVWGVGYKCSPAKNPTPSQPLRMRSLRFRLPALFLAGIIAAGFVSVAIAFQLLSNYSRSQSLKELRREAAGLNALIAQQATDVIDLGQSAPAIEPGQLEKATGDR